MNNTNTVGYSTATNQNLLLDSGCLYLNYGEPTEVALGATAGGSEFSYKPKFRQVGADGLKSSNVKGGEILIDSQTVLKVNLLEVTETVLKMALLGTIDTTSDPVFNLITGKTIVTTADYVDNIALVARISGSGVPVVIIIYNVLNIDGFDLKTQDAKDAVLSLSFTANLDPAFPNAVPFLVKFPKATSGLAFNLVGTPFVDNGKIRVSFTDVVTTPVMFSGFAVTSNGSANVITAATRDVNRTTDILLTLTTAPVAGQATTLAYTSPTLLANDTSSTSNVILPTFSSKTVNNN